MHFVTGIDWGLPNPATWAWDEVDTRSAWPLRYPPFHRQVLELSVGTARPFLSQGVAARAALDREVPLVARSLSVASTLVTLWLVYRIARLRFPRSGALLPPLAYAASLQVGFYARLANLEAPYLLWFAASLYFWQRARASGATRWVIAYAAAGALSFLTKDQALALYLLPTVWLVVEGRNPRTGVRRGAGARIGWGAVTLAGATVLLLVTLVYRLPRGWPMLVGHVWELLHGASERYRMVEASAEGQWELLGSAVRHVAFCATPTVALLLALAAASVLAHRADRRRWAPLMLFPLSYYLFFIAPIGYHYDRFFLPVLLVGVLLLPALGERLRAHVAPARVHALLAVLVVALALPGQVALGQRLRHDLRYDVERFLAAPAQATRGAVIFGAPELTPRGERRVREWNRLWPEICARVPAMGWIAVSPQEAQSRGSKRTLHWALTAGLLGHEHFASIARSEDPALDFSRVSSNLAVVSPPIDLFRPASSICALSVEAWYEEVRARGDARERERLLRHLFAEPWRHLRVRDDATGRIVAFGLTADGWTHGTMPGVVAVEPALSGWPRLRVATWGDAALYPLEIAVADEAGTTRRISLAQGGVAEIDLTGEASLAGPAFFEVRAMRSWVPRAEDPSHGDARELGIQLVADAVRLPAWK